jgi:pimeloyl-ACP methyl ester carboxylesterase
VRFVLNHVRRGAGPPLVLVHGIGDRLETWEPVMDRLAAERDVVALDLPGFGRSPRPGAAPTVEALADAVEALAGELGLDGWHVAGNSLGGGIAVELARRGSVRSATALSPIGFWSRREAAYARAMLQATIAGNRRFGDRMAPLVRTGAGRRMLFGYVYQHPERIPPDVLVEGIGALRASNFDATLQRIHGWIPNGPPTVPTTVAWAEHDRLLLPRQARRARRAWPQARHVTLTGCGHVPCWDDPGQVARVLLERSAI